MDKGATKHNVIRVLIVQNSSKIIEDFPKPLVKVRTCGRIRCQ